MTREQIEYMRYGVEIGEYKLVNEEVGRLLDEREALLEALTGLEVWVTKNVAIPFDTSRPAVEIPALAAARRVLAKAEAP